MKKPFLSLITFFLCLFYLSEVVFAATYSFAVIGDPASVPEIKNIYTMFNNLGIKNKTLLPSEVVDETVFSDVDGIISFVDSTGTITNITAVKSFASSHLVISHAYDFAKYYYPSLSNSYGIGRYSTNDNPITYLVDWGNFRKDDKVEMQRSDRRTLGILLTSRLDSAFPNNLTKIVKYNATHTGSFRVNDTQTTGFYVMDLKATVNESKWIGIWHLFPVVKMVKSFPTGKYSRWMANGASWWDLDWINNYIDNLVTENSDIATKMILPRKSVLGRDINAIVIGNGNRYAIMDGCIHGNEKIGAFSMLRIAELLIEYYRSDSSWQTKLNQYKIIIIPVLNVDGYVANTRENANGKDLNRQFPPGGTTTEPETWALRDMIDYYQPTIYVNLHEAGCSYPKLVIYGTYQDRPFMDYTVSSLRSFTRAEYNYLKHWGWAPNCSSYKFWIGTADMAGAGITSMAIEYASYAANSSSLLLESFVWSDSVGSRNALWGLDYYTSIPIGQLKHYDYDGTILSISNGFISGINSVGNTATISLNTSELTTSSKTTIQDMKVRGKPIEVRIDGVKKDEGNGWNYYSDNKNLTITGATNSIFVDWSGVTTTTIMTTTTSSTTTTTTTSTTTVTSTTSTTTTILGTTTTSRSTTTTIGSTTTTTSTTTTLDTTTTTLYDLVGYWRFDDCTATDSSGTDNDGIIYESLCVNGRIRKALSFDGIDDVVNITDSNSLDITNAITIEAWVHLNSWSSNYPRIVSKEVTTTAAPYAIELVYSPYSYATFCINTNVSEVCTNTGNNSIELNKWYHFVGTWNGTKTLVYLNGQLKNSRTQAGTMATTNNNVLIGNNPSSNRQFEGIIDEVRVYNRSLSPEEIKDHFNVRASISGQLRNTKNEAVESEIIVYNQGTDQINESYTTDTSGYYNFSVWPNTYDLQYRNINFLIPNFFIKLISFDVDSYLPDIVNFIDGYPSRNITFTVDIETDQQIQVYSEEKPNMIKSNDNILEEVNDSSLLLINTWFYNPTEKKIYILTTHQTLE